VSNDLKINTPDGLKFYYPDVAVVCGDGCACVMAGASENDNIITLNTASVLLANPRGKTTFAREWLPKRTMWENFLNADMITAEMRLTDSDSVTLLARARKLRPTQLTIWTEFRAA
jgi:hypothetical protein